MALFLGLPFPSSRLSGAPRAAARGRAHAPRGPACRSPGSTFTFGPGAEEAGGGGARGSRRGPRPPGTACPCPVRPAGRRLRGRRRAHPRRPTRLLPGGLGRGGGGLGEGERVGRRGEAGLQTATRDRVVLGPGPKSKGKAAGAAAGPARRGPSTPEVREHGAGAPNARALLATPLPDRQESPSALRLVFGLLPAAPSSRLLGGPVGGLGRWWGPAEDDTLRIVAREMNMALGLLLGWSGLGARSASVS